MVIDLRELTSTVMVWRGKRTSPTSDSWKDDDPSAETVMFDLSDVLIVWLQSTADEQTGSWNIASPK